MPERRPNLFSPLPLPPLAPIETLTCKVFASLPLLQHFLFYFYRNRKDILGFRSFFFLVGEDGRLGLRPSDSLRREGP